MGATIKDVAKMASVSVTTVSHVINDTRFVSEELRDRVQAAIKELNYSPNGLARSLRGGNTRTIGLILPDNSNPFFAEIARQIEDIGFKNGYSVILCNSDGDLHKEAAYIEVLITKQVDGIIFIASGGNHAHIQKLQAQGIPMVVADRDLGELPIDTVMVNNYQGGYEAVNYLLDLGHRKIGCITGPSGITPSAERVRGYRNALSDRGIAVKEEYIVSADFRYQTGAEAMQILLGLDDPPSAVFACNDMMAIGALRTLRALNLKLPESLSIIGFDDIELAQAVVPSLSTIKQPVGELANISINMLMERMQKDSKVKKAKKIILDTQLIIRESCGKLVPESV